MHQCSCTSAVKCQHSHEDGMQLCLAISSMSWCTSFWYITSHCVLCTRSKIVREGSDAEVRGALQSIEREVAPVLHNLPLYEPLFQLMCHGVPTSVKAALNDSLAALARFRDLAPRLLERLVQCAVVAMGQADAYPGE